MEMWVADWMSSALVLCCPRMLKFCTLKMGMKYATAPDEGGDAHDDGGDDRDASS